MSQTDITLVCVDVSGEISRETAQKKLAKKQGKKFEHYKREVNNKPSLNKNDKIVPSSENPSRVAVTTHVSCGDSSSSSSSTTKTKKSRHEDDPPETSDSVAVVKRKRGRPPKQNFNNVEASVDIKARNPITNHPVDHGNFTVDQYSDSSEQHQLFAINEDEEMDFTTSDSFQETATQTFVSKMEVKDPRLNTYYDYIKNFPDAYLIDSVPLTTFEQLRRECKATFCLNDPAHVFLGNPTPSSVRFESSKGDLDRWPNVKRFQPPDLSSGYFKSASDFDNVAFDSDNFVDILEEEKMSLLNFLQKTSKDGGGKFLPSPFTESSFESPAKSAKKREESLKKMARPVYKPDSVSALTLEVVRDIVDDKSTNPAYFGTGLIDKHKRGLHDNRYSRLCTTYESDGNLFRYLDKYHIKNQKHKWERKVNQFDTGGHNHIIKRIGSEVMTKGITDETVKSGIDYVPLVLGRSDDLFTTMDPNEFCTELKAAKERYLKSTNNERIPDITNEIKNFCTNFSLVYDPTLLRISTTTKTTDDGKETRGFNIPFSVRRKDAPLFCYSTGDMFSERHSNTSYVQKCFDIDSLPIIGLSSSPSIQREAKDLPSGKFATFSTLDSESNAIDQVVLTKEQLAESYDDFCREKGFFRNTVFFRYFVANSLTKRLFCTRCPLIIIGKFGEDSHSKSDRHMKRKRKSDKHENEKPSKKNKSSQPPPTKKEKPKEKQAQKDEEGDFQVTVDENDIEIHEDPLEEDNIASSSSSSSKKKKTSEKSKRKNKKGTTGKKPKGKSKSDHIVPEKGAKSSSSDYQNIFPMFHFFIDNPSQQSTFSQNIQKTLLFDTLNMAFESIPEIILFTRPKDSRVDRKKLKSHVLQINNSSSEHAPSSNQPNIELSSYISGSMNTNTERPPTKNQGEEVEEEEKTEEGKEEEGLRSFFLPPTMGKWSISSELKHMLDIQKSPSNCWYTVRKSVCYPAPRRRTSTTVKVAFYMNRMMVTEMTFRADRPQVIGGYIVKNAVSEFRKPDATSSSSTTEIVSPFVPIMSNVFSSKQQPKSSTNENLFMVDEHDEKGRKEIISACYNDNSVNHALVEFISHGPAGRAIKDALKSGVQQLIGKRLKPSSSDSSASSSSGRRSLYNMNTSNVDYISAQSRHSGSSKDNNQKVIISDGVHIGYMYNKSWEVLGSTRLHHRQNSRLVLLTKSYIEGGMRPVNENNGERPCVKGLDCICSKGKAREDILPSREQRSQAFTAPEFLLPHERLKFLMNGELPKVHGCCVLCKIFQVNLFVNFFAREGFEPSHVIQDFGVVVDDTDNGYRTVDTLPYTSGPQELFNGLIAPYPIYRESDLIYIVLKHQNIELKRIKLKNTSSHFYMASIANLMGFRQSKAGYSGNNNPEDEQKQTTKEKTVKNQPEKAKIHPPSSSKTFTESSGKMAPVSTTTKMETEPKKEFQDPHPQKERKKTNVIPPIQTVQDILELEHYQALDNLTKRFQILTTC